MARETALTNTLIYGPNVVGAVTRNSVTANTSFYVDSDQLDERTIFEYTPAADSASVRAEVGTGYTASNYKDFDAATSGTTYAFTLDSARHIIASGENAGLIKFTPTKNGTFAIIQPKV